MLSPAQNLKPSTQHPCLAPSSVAIKRPSTMPGSSTCQLQDSCWLPATNPIQVSPDVTSGARVDLSYSKRIALAFVLTSVAENLAQAAIGNEFNRTLWSKTVRVRFVLPFSGFAQTDRTLDRVNRSGLRSSNRGHGICQTLAECVVIHRPLPQALGNGQYIRQASVTKSSFSRAHDAYLPIFSNRRLA